VVPDARAGGLYGPPARAGWEIKEGGFMVAQTDSDRARSNSEPPVSDRSPLDELVAAVTDLRGHAALYLEVRRDLVAAKVRTAILKSAVAALTALAGIAVVATAVVFILVGAADGLGAALGERMWAGKLIVGALVVAGVGLFAWRMVERSSQKALRRTVAKYESQHVRH
jgi:hypothetical protein